jgi:hypothetical protein
MYAFGAFLDLRCELGKQRLNFRNLGYREMSPKTVNLCTDGITELLYLVIQLT